MGGTAGNGRDIVISIAERGAIPDPAADNTAAIQAALNAATTSTETRTVIAPPGMWGTRRVTVPAGVTFEGDGGTLKHLAVTTTEACVEIVGDDATLYRLGIDGDRAGQTVKNYGVLVSANRATIERVRVRETVGTGILVSGRVGHRIERVHVHDTSENGIGFTRPGSGIAATDFSIYGALIERTNDGGIGVLGQNFNVTGCTTRDTGGDGITAYADQNGHYSLIGNNMYGVGNNGIHSAGPGATITGNTIRDCIHRGIYHLSEGLLLQEGVAIASNYVRKTGLAGYEVWPARALAMVGNVMIDTAASAYDIRQSDVVSMIGNVASKAAHHAFKFAAVSNISGAGNVGTGITLDLLRLEDGALMPQSRNGIFVGTVGNGSARAMNFVDTAGWFNEFGTMPGATGANPYAMGGATNRRI